MSGHVGDLSPKQEKALNEFKQRIQDIWKDDFTDSFLLRWLRARDFDIQKAEEMLRKNQAWRKENNIDSLLETYQWPEVLKRYFMGGMCSHDREGRPLWIMRFGNCDFKGLLQSVSREEIFKAIFCQFEEVEADMRSQSKKLNKTVETITAVSDYENFSLRQMYSVGALEFLKETMQVTDANYPELLERGLVINAPSFFPIFWKLVRHFMPERTASKLEVYSKDGWKEALLKYVDPSELPVHYGGELLGPDNDPECSHAIGRGGKVPEEFYRKNMPKVSDDPHSKTCFLERGQSLEVPVKVTHAGCVLSWKLQTDPGHDLDFSITRSFEDKGKEKEQVLPKCRIKCDHVPETGQLENPEIGTYTFKFDNSFSWITGKQLSYVLQVKNAENAPVPEC